MSNPIDKNYLPPELAAQILERDAEIEANPLDPGIRELLIVLAEECGETVQRVTKILRFGFTTSPWTGKNNRDELELELADIGAMVRALDAHGVINLDRVNRLVDKKLAALRPPNGRLRHAKIPEGA